jgi:acetyl esterase
VPRTRCYKPRARVNNTNNGPANMNLRKYPKTIVALIVLILAIAYSYSWTYTPYGRLDYRAALSLHLMTFTYHYKPDPNKDFEIALPVNLIYSLSDWLPTEKVDAVKNITIPGKGVTIPARVYWPQGVDKTQAVPIIVYFHGGGFTVGSVQIFDALTRSLANATHAVVVSIDYRLAPANPYPAAVEDCYAATEWVAENAASFGGDPKKLAVAGDSAGGNLSAVVALKARDAGGPTIAAQIMYYPAVDLTDAHYDSKEKFSNGFGLSSASGDKFEYAYAAKVQDHKDPYLSPLYVSSVAGLPPALIVTEGFDPLTGPANAYADRLEQGGVRVTRLHYPDMIHGFMSIRFFPQRRQSLIGTSQFLNEVLQSHSSSSPGNG